MINIIVSGINGRMGRAIEEMCKTSDRFCIVAGVDVNLGIPHEFPAVSDPDVLFSLIESAKELKFPYHAGVVQSKDSFYGQHSPNRMPTASALNEKWEAWKRLGVLASEMEASTLFVVGAALGLRCGAVFHVVWNQERYDLGLDTDAEQNHDTDKAIQTAVKAIELLISQ